MSENNQVLVVLPAQKPSGFTLIEMLITLAILALLATLATPMMELTVKRQKEHELRTALREIRTAIDTYKKASDEGKITRKADESGYPPTIKALYEGVVDATDLQNKKIYFLRRLPRDPFYPDTTVAADESWGKRSYESEFDKPREGRDVYDVYSLSPDTALNGTPYREW
jgi:general secretion pathway protein G